MTASLTFIATKCDLVPDHTVRARRLEAIVAQIAQAKQSLDDLIQQSMKSVEGDIADIRVASRAR